MFEIIFNVFYVIVAIAMTVLILLQRGPGATAGASFGGGASATVFGARSASGFMGRSTWTLATIFLLMSLGMAWHLSRQATSTGEDLGVMGAVVEQQKAASEVPALTVPAATTSPATTPSDVPAVPAAAAGEQAAPEAVKAAASTAIDADQKKGEEQADENVKATESP